MMYLDGNTHPDGRPLRPGRYRRCTVRSWRQCLLLAAGFLLSVGEVQAFKMEVDVVELSSTNTVDSDVERVEFQQTYGQTPVVFVFATDDLSGSQPLVLRVSDVDRSGFSLSMWEGEGTDGGHEGSVSVTYLAVEAGVHQLPDGRWLEAGTLDTTSYRGRIAGSESWDWVDLEPGIFSSTPVVLAQVQSMHNEVSYKPGPGTVAEPLLAAAVHGVSASGLWLALERGETSNGSVDYPERIGYLAVEEGYGLSIVDDNGNGTTFASQLWESAVQGLSAGCAYTYLNAPVGLDNTPRVLASANTRNGADGGWLESCGVDMMGASPLLGLVVEEDRAVDTETSHIAESAGILSFSGSFAADFDDVYESDEAVDSELRWESDTVSLPSQECGAQQRWTRVDFRQEYDEAPLVFVLSSGGGAGRMTVRVRNVTETGFDALQVEAWGDDGCHSAVDVRYLAVESGSYLMSDGTRLEAYAVELLPEAYVDLQAGYGGWASVGFTDTYSEIPAILTTVQTARNGINENVSLLSGAPEHSPFIAGAAAVQNVTRSGFEMALELGETSSNYYTPDRYETVAFLAIDGDASSVFTDNSGGEVRLATALLDGITGGAGCVFNMLTVSGGDWGSSNMLAGINSHNGVDGGWLRDCGAGGTTIGLYVQEDVARDSETSHVTGELAGVVAFSRPFDAATEAIVLESGSALSDEQITYLLSESAWPSGGVDDSAMEDNEVTADEFLDPEINESLFDFVEKANDSATKWLSDLDVSTGLSWAGGNTLSFLYDTLSMLITCPNGWQDVSSKFSTAGVTYQYCDGATGAFPEFPGSDALSAFLFGWQLDNLVVSSNGLFYTELGVRSMNVDWIDATIDYIEPRVILAYAPGSVISSLAPTYLRVNLEDDRNYLFGEFAFGSFGEDGSVIMIGDSAMIGGALEQYAIAVIDFADPGFVVQTNMLDYVFGGTVRPEGLGLSINKHIGMTPSMDIYDFDLDKWVTTEDFEDWSANEDTRERDKGNLWMSAKVRVPPHPASPFYISGRVLMNFDGDNDGHSEVTDLFGTQGGSILDETFGDLEDVLRDSYVLANGPLWVDLSSFTDVLSKLGVDITFILANSTFTFDGKHGGMSFHVEDVDMDFDAAGELFDDVIPDGATKVGPFVLDGGDASNMVVKLFDVLDDFYDATSPDYYLRGWAKADFTKFPVMDDFEVTSRISMPVLAVLDMDVDMTVSTQGIALDGDFGFDGGDIPIVSGGGSVHVPGFGISASMEVDKSNCSAEVGLDFTAALLSVIVNPCKPSVTVSDDFLAALKTVWKVAQKIGAEFERMGEEIGDAVVIAANWVADGTTQLADLGVEGWGYVEYAGAAVAATTEQVVLSAGESVVDFGVTVGNFVTDDVAGAFHVAGSSTAEVAIGAGEAVLRIGQDPGTAAKAVVKFMGDSAEAAIDELKNVEVVFDETEDFAISAWDESRDAFATITDEAGNAIMLVNVKVWTANKTLYFAARDGVETAGIVIADGTTAAVYAVADGTTAAALAVSSGLRDLGGGIADAAESTAGWFEKTGEDAVDWLEGAGSDTLDWFEDVGGEIGDFFENVGGAIGDFFNSFF